MNKNKKMYTRFKNVKKKPIIDNFINKFIDFNKNERIFYNNLYLDEYKLVIKIPLSLAYKKGIINEIKIEEFKLADSIYFFSYN
ncbi:MAG: hypothetical protein ACFFD2_12700 [Promethearchaeota archaeon]